MTMRITLLSLATLAGASALAQFTETERTAVLDYWKDKVRYISSPSKPPKGQGTFQIRMTPAGSAFLWQYYRSLGYGKIRPGTEPEPRNAQEAAWKTWIDAKFAYDRYMAAEECRKSNKSIGLGALPQTDTQPVEDPGPAPADLNFAGPTPTKFSEAVVPRTHQITFEDGRTFTNEDNALRRPRYLYYRFAQGVAHGGTQVKTMAKSDLQRLYQKAGLDESRGRILSAVSLLEGGFDSINTYDTGFVSAGVIQFASLKEGGGSLGEMMTLYKNSNPKAFQRDFRRFGLDVNSLGLLVAIDLKTGRETVGADANMTIINEPRLAAVFQYSGAVSEEYRVAQIQGAFARFWPGEERLKLVFAGQPSTQVRVGDFVRSEAGLATLMDRKVNTGKTDPFASVVQQIVDEYGIESVAQLAGMEAMVVARIKYRKDYLADASLGQPRDSGSATSRGGDPKRGKKGKSK